MILNIEYEFYPLLHNYSSFILRLQLKKKQLEQSSVAAILNTTKFKYNTMIVQIGILSLLKCMLRFQSAFKTIMHLCMSYNDQCSNIHMANALKFARNTNKQDFSEGQGRRCTNGELCCGVEYYVEYQKVC